MAAGSYDINIEQGVSYSLNLIYADSGNIPIDLSAFNCARMQWNTTDGGTYQFTTNNTNSGLYYFAFNPAISGIISLKIPASITAGYEFTNAVYDLELESIADFYPGGGPQVIRLLQGNVTVSPEITKINCSGA